MVSRGLSRATEAGKKSNLVLHFFHHWQEAMKKAMNKV